jgi:hypothetical protein
MRRFQERLSKTEQIQLLLLGATNVKPEGPIQQEVEYHFLTLLDKVVAKAKLAKDSKKCELEFLVPVSNVDT